MKDCATTISMTSNVDVPLGVLTSVTGISGSGKSSFVGQLLVELVARHLGHSAPPPSSDEADELEAVGHTIAGRITSGLDRIKRLVTVDQKPIGRTPRSNLATYTGYLMTSVSALLTPKRLVVATTMLASFRSMWRKADVKLVRVKALCLSNSYFFRAFTPMSHL